MRNHNREIIDPALSLHHGAKLENNKTRYVQLREPSVHDEHLALILLLHAPSRTKAGWEEGTSYVLLEQPTVYQATARTTGAAAKLERACRLSCVSGLLLFQKLRNCLLSCSSVLQLAFQ